MVNVASHNGIARPATIKSSRPVLSEPSPDVVRRRRVEWASQPIATNDAYIRPIATSAIGLPVLSEGLRCFA